MLPTVTSISFGVACACHVSCVPHAPHNARVARVEDAKRVGSPLTTSNLFAGKVAQQTNGAPLVRRQSVQWQLVTDVGFPLTR